MCEKKITVEEAMYSKDIKIEFRNPMYMNHHLSPDTVMTVWVTDDEADRLAFHLQSVLQDKERKNEHQEIPLSPAVAI